MFVPRSLGQLFGRLLRTPLFSIVAVVTLGIGIGANAALFSVVYGVVLKPLPYPEPERLAGVWHRAPGMPGGGDGIPMGPAFYFTYRDETRTFEELGLWTDRAASVTGVGEPERLDAMSVTDGTLRALRVVPAAGRVFTREDDTPGTPETVVLAYAYWQRKFGGDPGIIGRQLTIDGKPRQVIGVLPQTFKFLRSDPALFLPMRFNRAEAYVGNFSYVGIARLKPGAALAGANSDLARMIPIVLEGYPLPPGFTKEMVAQIRFGPDVRPLSRDVVGDIGGLLWVLLGMVGIVLLIACANVANLFLVRAEGRQRELAIRSALGAGPGRIARELLGESLALGLAGGVLGLALAWGAVRLLRAIAPAGLPRLDEISIDPVVLLFTLAVSAVAGLLFGLIPVAKFAVPRLAALKDGGRSASDSRERHRVRNVLVVAEVALALVLLISSGLMARTFVALRNVNPGYSNPEEVLTFRINVPPAMAAEDEQAARVHEQVVQRLRQVPGMTAVGLSTSVTMDGNSSHDPVLFEDFPQPPGQMPVMRWHKWIGPGYFGAMGNRIVAGRDLTWTDIYNRAPVALVAENLARLYYKRPADAVGRRVRPSPADPWREIIGVVGDEHDAGVALPPPPIVYWPFLLKDFWQQPSIVRRSQSYVVRSARLSSAGFFKEVQQAVWSVSPDLPLADVRTLDQIRARSMAQTSFMLVMLAIAAVVALLLGVVGIYGVIAYIAAQRTREVGIRMALGAQRVDVSRLFLRHGLALTGVGVALGIALAFGLTRLLSAQLFGVSPADAPTYIGVSAGLATVALLATWLPARRAARVDPVIALRADV